MNDRSATTRSNGCTELGGIGVSDVGALDHRDALVGSKRPRELPVADVDGNHVRGAALEQAVGESAGRRADVDRRDPGDVEPEGIERAGELHSAARHVAWLLGDLDESSSATACARLGDRPDR